MDPNFRQSIYEAALTGSTLNENNCFWGKAKQGIDIPYCVISVIGEPDLRETLKDYPVIQYRFDIYAPLLSQVESIMTDLLTMFDKFTPGFDNWIVIGNFRTNIYTEWILDQVWHGVLEYQTQYTYLTGNVLLNSGFPDIWIDTLGDGVPDDWALVGTPEWSALMDNDLAWKIWVTSITPGAFSFGCEQLNVPFKVNQAYEIEIDWLAWGSNSRAFFTFTDPGHENYKEYDLVNITTPWNQRRVESFKFKAVPGMDRIKLIFEGNITVDNGGGDIYHITAKAV